MSTDCVFCQIATGEQPATIVYQNEQVMAFEDIHPAAPVHVLIIPRRHITSLAHLEDGDAALMGEVIMAAAQVARLKGVTDFQLLTNTGRGAGQRVFHLHFHLLAGRRLTWTSG